MLGIVETVHMVDAQSVQKPRFDKFKDEPMRRLEHIQQFHAQRSQGIDVEESAIVNFLSRDPPVAQPVILHIEQRVESIVGMLVSRRLEIIHLAADGSLDGGVRRAKLPKTALDDQLLPGALKDFLRAGVRAMRKVLRLGDDAFQFADRVLRLLASQSARARPA